MEIIIKKTAEEAGRAAARLLAEVVQKKPESVLGLATGSTPLPVYRELIDMERRGEVDFSRVHTVNLDEYVGLGPDHPQSYRRFMEENLFCHLSIAAENTFVPDGLAADIPAACDAYEEKIAALGGIDLQLLGIGHDGHIGFNEPDRVFSVGTHQVHLTAMTREANARFFPSAEEVPASAVTMGVGTVMQAEKLVLLATGADKAEIVKKALEGEVDPQVPASVIRLHRNVTVILDKAAASRLSQGRESALKRI